MPDLYFIRPQNLYLMMQRPLALFQVVDGSLYWKETLNLFLCDVPGSVHKSALGCVVCRNTEMSLSMAPYIQNMSTSCLKFSFKSGEGLDKLFVLDSTWFWLCPSPNLVQTLPIPLYWHNILLDNVLTYSGSEYVRSLSKLYKMDSVLSFTFARQIL